jgi:FkbM family methyltransferase
MSLRDLVPLAARERVMRSPVGRVVRRLDPGRRAIASHPLQPPLDGLRMFAHNEVERQYVRAAYEPALWRVLQEVAAPGMRVADVGANVGYTALLLSRATAPGGTIVAFEADHTNAQRAQRNIELNDLSDVVTIEEIAIADRAARARLHPGATGSEFSLLGAAGDGVDVETAPLDNYGPFDLVKIDVEGAEELVLRGMRRLLREGRPTLLMELHGDPQTTLSLLEAADYGVEPYDGDRFIVARPR